MSEWWEALGDCGAGDAEEAAQAGHVSWTAVGDDGLAVLADLDGDGLADHAGLVRGTRWAAATTDPAAAAAAAGWHVADSDDPGVGRGEIHPTELSYPGWGTVERLPSPGRRPWFPLPRGANEGPV